MDTLCVCDISCESHSSFDELVMVFVWSAIGEIGGLWFCWLTDPSVKCPCSHAHSQNDMTYDFLIV